MYADPLTIDDGVDDYNFYRIRTDGNASFYAADSNTASKARTLRVLHAQGAKNPVEPTKRAQRHVITLGLTDYDSSVPRTDVATVGLTIVDPNVSTITRAEINQLLTFLTTFLGVTDNVDKLLRGEL